MLPASIIKKLRDIVGSENILTSKEERICYAYDATNQQFLPDAILFPRSANEISEIMRLANSEGFPVIPRGAGSGTSGGSLPVEGGVVLSLEQMNRIIEIDTENLTAVVEPGVVNVDLQIEAEKHRLAQALALKDAAEIGKDYGDFDLICHIAFGQPPLTRKERANKVKKRNYFTNIRFVK